MVESNESSSLSSAATPAPSVYARQRKEACDDLTTYFKGSLDAFIAVVSSAVPAEEVRSALLATARHGGFEAKDVLWVSVDDALLPEQLMRLLETVDPLCVIVLDQRAAEMLSRAYNQPIGLESVDSLLGRPACCFVDFERSLQTEERKQKAWSLLKKMLAQVNDI